MAAQIRFVSAGAGSGKTYALTKILSEELAGKRARPSGVIATTFTRKAAAELRERVRSHLIGEGEYAMANAMGQARIGTVNGVCGGLLERAAFPSGSTDRGQRRTRSRRATNGRDSRARTCPAVASTLTALSHRSVWRTRRTVFATA